MSPTDRILPEAQLSITRPPRGETVSRVVAGRVMEVAGASIDDADDGRDRNEVEWTEVKTVSGVGATDEPARRTVYEHLCDLAERLTDVGGPTARAQREALSTACDIVLRARPLGADIEEGLIDEDPPQEHETMSHAMTLAGIDLRDALADLRDAERDLEVERREAAKARQRLADAINSMSSARDMTGDPNVARYLAIAIEQAEFPLPLAEVMR